METLKDINEYLKRIKKVNSHRNHKVKNSWGVYDAYKYIRKNKWQEVKRPLTEKEFYSIIRTVNRILAEELSKGNDIIFPENMGRIELRKTEGCIKQENGMIKNNFITDWMKTLKYWFEDKDAENKRILIKKPEKEIFSIVYLKSKAKYNNKAFYRFEAVRSIKQSLKNNIVNNNIDAFYGYRKI